MKIKLDSEENTHLGLLVGFETQKTPDLLRTGVDDASANEIIYVRIYSVQELHAESEQLSSSSCQVHRSTRFENFLSSLLITENGIIRKKIHDENLTENLTIRTLQDFSIGRRMIRRSFQSVRRICSASAVISWIFFAERYCIRKKSTLWVYLKDVNAFSL